MLVSDARELAQSLLSEELPTRWLHVQAVAGRAQMFAEKAHLSESLVAAAWLHDIGYASTLTDCGFHPIDGARFLRARAWPSEVFNLVAFHSCASIEAGRRGLGSILEDEFIDTPGEIRDALWAADATTGPDGTHLSVDSRVEEVVARYGPGTLVAECMREIAPSLADAERRTNERIQGLIK